MGRLRPPTPFPSLIVAGTAMTKSRAHTGAERAALLSALLPGLGQWWSGNRRRGLLWAIPAVLGIGIVVAVLFWVRSGGAAGLLAILVQPRWLWALLIGNFLLAAERVAAVADAWWPLRDQAQGSRRVWGMRAAAVAVTAALLVPHVIVDGYAAEALDLLDTVFAEPDLPPLQEREAGILAEGFTEEDLGPTTTTTTARPGPAVVPDSIPGADPVSEPLSPLGDRYTVLLAGGDFGPGRHDLRTDVMIVASLDMVSGTASLIGVSRDLANAPLPSAWANFNTMHQVQSWHEDQAGIPHEEFCDCFYDRINYLHVLTATWVRTFPDAPDPGMEALRQTLELLLGLKIDAYVLVDFAGFVDLVDALGGVRVTVTESLHEALSPAREGEPPVVVDVEPGVHVLDGHEALAYVRDRTGSSDNERMRRQRCMIRELASSARAGTLLRSFPTISRAIRESTVTTLPLDLLPAVIGALSDLDGDDIATLAIDRRYSSERSYLNLPIVEPAKVRRAVADLLAGVAERTTLGSVEECG